MQSSGPQTERAASFGSVSERSRAPTRKADWADDKLPTLCHPSPVPSLSMGLPSLPLAGLEETERDLYIPSVICGDLDSVTEHPQGGSILDFYRGKGSSILQDERDDRTDFFKCLERLQARPDAAKLNIVVLGALGGRLDQEMQNFNALCVFSRSFEHLVLLSEETYAVLLPTGKSFLTPVLPVEGPYCGLIPLAGPVQSLSTHGLKWDMKDYSTSFGGPISSSNMMVAAEGNKLADPRVKLEQLLPHTHIHTTHPATTAAGMETVPGAGGAGGGAAGATVAAAGGVGGVHVSLADVPHAVTVESSAPILFTASLNWGRWHQLLHLQEQQRLAQQQQWTGLTEAAKEGTGPSAQRLKQQQQQQGGQGLQATGTSSGSSSGRLGGV